MGFQRQRLRSLLYSSFLPMPPIVINRPFSSFFRRCCICTLLVWSVFLGWPVPAPATTVDPPNFEELVKEADVVFEGVVTEIHASWVGAGATRHIESAVSFRVLDTLKGQAATPYVLKTAGGTVGNVRMEIADAPAFAVGQRMILFVEKNGTQFIPLVGVMHGQIRIARDEVTQRDVLRDQNDRTLFGVNEIGRSEEARSMERVPKIPMAPLTPEGFKAQIRKKLQEISGQ